MQGRGDTRNPRDTAVSGTKVVVGNAGIAGALCIHKCLPRIGPRSSLDPGYGMKAMSSM